MSSWLSDPFNTSTPTRKREKTNTSTSTTTGGSAAGEVAGQWGLGQYQGMMDPTAYGGNVPGAQGWNQSQQQGFDILSGMQPGAVGTAVGNMTPQQIAAMNRSGGPGAGYMSPYQDQMIAGANRDMQTAMQMAGNMESDMAQQYSAGGPSSSRSANQRYGAMGDIGLKYHDVKNRIRDTGFRNAMGWQREDARDRASDITAMNQANLGFGDLRRRTAQDDISNQFGRSDRFNRMGQFDVGQQNMADNFGYGEFNRMQNWKPNMMNNYMSGVRGTPWQTTSTTTGTDTSSQMGQGGKSNFEKSLGLGLTVKGFMACIPEGTKIDTAEGPVPIEDIKAGTKVKGYYGETEVLQAHQYKEDPKPHRFYRITFDNGGTVDCCDMHRIYNKRAKDYKVGDSVQNTKVTSITRYNGVERSYDLLTTDGGYRIGNIPVNSMIEELSELAVALKQVAEAA